MLNRLTALVVKELTQFTRDRVLFVASLLAPLIQIILLGNAIGTDLVDIGVAVVDYDLSSLSREIVTALDNTSELKVTYFPERIEDAHHLVDAGLVTAIVVIPRGFEADTRALDRVAEMQVILDGSQSLVAARALAAATSAVQSLISDAVISTTGRMPGGVRVTSVALFNQALDLQSDAVTSQMALITFEITALVAVMGIVRERDIGTIEMLTITPLKRLELIAGKTITPLLIGFANFVILYIISRVVFEVPNRGSLAALLLVTLVYLSCEIGFALTLSTLTRTQQQAVTVVFVWIMIALTFSGYLVPISNLPESMQWISQFLPLRHYLSILRAFMLKGATPLDVSGDIAAIAALLVASIALATRTLSRAIE